MTIMKGIAARPSLVDASILRRVYAFILVVFFLMRVITAQWLAQGALFRVGTDSGQFTHAMQK